MTTKSFTTVQISTSGTEHAYDYPTKAQAKALFDEMVLAGETVYLYSPNGNCLHGNNPQTVTA